MYEIVGVLGAVTLCGGGDDWADVALGVWRR